MFNRRLVSAYMTHQSKIMMELFQAILSTKPSHLGLNGPRRPRKPSRRWAPDEEASASAGDTSPSVWEAALTSPLAASPSKVEKSPAFPYSTSSSERTPS